MGKIADELRERSKRDNEIIVGSEIRACISELEARIAELEAAVEWAVGKLAQTGSFATGNELRSRAFPPKFEEVTEKRMVCLRCQRSYCTDEHRDWCCQQELVEFSRTYQRPIVAKVRHREEIEINPASWFWKSKALVMSKAEGTRFFAEWEE